MQPLNSETHDLSSCLLKTVWAKPRNVHTQIKTDNLLKLHHKELKDIHFCACTACDFDCALSVEKCKKDTSLQLNMCL